jgi:DNA primase
VTLSAPALLTAALVARTQELHVSREITEVKAKLERMNPVTQMEEYNRLFGILIGLEQRRQQLRTRGENGFA